MPRRILSKTKSKIEAESRDKSKNKVFQNLTRPRRILSKTKSKIPICREQRQIEKQGFSEFDSAEAHPIQNEVKDTNKPPIFRLKA